MTFRLTWLSQKKTTFWSQSFGQIPRKQYILIISINTLIFAYKREVAHGLSPSLTEILKEKISLAYVSAKSTQEKIL